MSAQPANSHRHSAKTRALINIAKVNRKLSKFDRAASSLEYVRRRCSDLSHAYEYGAMLIRAGRIEEAAEQLSECAASEHAPAHWYYRYAVALERLKKFEEASEALSLAIQRDPKVSEYRYRKGVCSAALGKHEEAFHLYEAALHLNPDDSRAAERLASSLPQSVPLWRRLDVLEKALESAPQDRGLLLSHARSASWIGWYEHAAESYRKLLQEAQVDERDLYRYAVALEECQLDASEIYFQAVQNSRHETVRRLGVGGLHEQHLNFERAFDAYSAEWNDGRRSGEIAFKMGYTKERLYRWDEACNWYTQATQLEPGNSYWQYKVGLSSERLGRFRTAVVRYELAASLSPDNAKYWLYRAGICLLALGQKNLALGYMLRSYGTQNDEIKYEQSEVPVQPSDEAYRGVSRARRQIALSSPDVFLKSAELYAEVGRADRALECIVDYIKREEPRNHEEIGRASSILLRNGRNADALDLLLNGRDFKNPDGLNVDAMTKNAQERRSALYAEYVETHRVDPATILYESYWGTNLSCHPLALYKELRNDPRATGFNHVWVVQKTANIPEQLLDDPSVIFVKYGSDRYLRYLATAKYLINNTTFVPYFLRRPEQKYLNTWHGTPLKTLGRQVNVDITEHANVTRNLLQASHLIAPNEHTKQVLLRDFDISGISKAPVKVLGSPRLDQVVKSESSQRLEIRRKLGIADDDSRRIVFFAPTWRGTNTSREVDVERLKEDIEALDALPDTIVLFRGHHLTEGQLAGTSVQNRVVTREVDTYQVLQIVDTLVTDYSSLLFDFLVTGRRVIAYVPDEEEYSERRGLYFKPSEVVTEVAYNRTELCRLVNGCDEHTVDELYRDSKQRYTSLEDGYAARRAVDFLFSDQEYDSRPMSKPTVGFFASLLPNGITSALRDLINALPEDQVGVVLFVEANLQDTSHIDAFIKSLRRRVQVITRKGSPVFTLEERKAFSELKRSRKIESEGHRHILRSGFRRELRRLVGDVSLASVMQFEGYASYWTALFAQARSIGASSSIYLHNEMSHEVKTKYPYLREIFQWLSDYDCVATVSKAVAERNEEYLKNEGFLPADREVYWLRNVLDEARVLDLSEEEHLLGGPLGSPRIISVGRLSVEKNHQLLIEAMPSVLAEYPGASLTILGDGPLRSSLEARVSAMGLEAHIEFKGQVSNPYPFIRGADVFALPSLHEGQPVVLFESLVLGTPFVAAPTPGTRELADLFGLHVTEATVDEFSRALMEAFESQEAVRCDMDDINSSALARFMNVLAICGSVVECA